MNNTKHPSQFSDDELQAMLRIERRKVTHNLILAKRALRELVSTIEGLEARLRNIESSEDYLATHKVGAM